MVVMIKVAIGRERALPYTLSSWKPKKRTAVVGSIKKL
jgi:hypothetical protein